MAWRHRMIGQAARLYWRVLRPRTLGVRAVVTNGEGHVALVRHTYADHWYLPGGGVKKGESFEAALLRELEEEIALKEAVIERVVGVYHSKAEAKDDHIVIFSVRARNGMELTDINEIQEAKWFSFDELPVETSPATLRRLDEYRKGAMGLGQW